MNRFTSRAVTVAATACALAALAGVASADDAGFLDTLAQMGHPQTPANRQGAIDLGRSICSDLAANGGDKSATVLVMQDAGWSMQGAADFVVVAASELCPQYK